MFFTNYQFRLFSVLPLALLGFFLLKNGPDKKTEDFAVIAYYAGNGQDLDKYEWNRITHVIYSFCHLKGQELAVDNAKDSITIRNLVALKKQYKHLKVLLSLGGWGGCKTCSPVFATDEGREVFARSVKKLTKTYRTDGLDLDWEYPGIEGVPGHPFMAEDKQNFTMLVEQLRRKLGKKAILSFAAGGFEKYFEHSIEWDKVMPLVDYVNLMSYDLVGGYSKVTGHHTPLYSNPDQTGSGDYGVQYLIDLGVPSEKIIIGAAFYGRSWSGVKNVNNGLYQSGTFKSFIPHHRFDQALTAEQGFVFYRDPVSKAPYAYSAKLNEFATFDDEVSIRLKTKYAMDKKLGGIMFWQLTDDRTDGGLLRAISEGMDQN
ncbi:glycoside hydrolase family 18 protein [Flavilitoribacter nigricans]|uniref:chitinase n=1 Tax=Flavilitoribacter nigricans (strain ATCC 23147 / DSM 23189 / NBRC 102662 / NCIMB 1420 / SS-2) TaxID=1122177 RepID=A0A2D0N550_FLAN2|nr:glycoside hydrolase family 18 protein [Flavilitoribacter nigricans]PHN03510.1 glycoside hydrolase [Flavilitoribacter nigricans DSM 23189 = NBRC 102662]